MAKKLFSSVWVDAVKEIVERKNGSSQERELWAESTCRTMFLCLGWSD